MQDVGRKRVQNEKIIIYLETGYVAPVVHNKNNLQFTTKFVAGFAWNFYYRIK